MTKKQEAIVKRWVKALLSGKYKQGKNRLATVTEDGVEYCCLGVLCELAVRSKVIPKPLKNGVCLEYGPTEDYSRSITFLPKEVMTWAGIKYREGRYGNDNSSSLSIQNDSDKSFADIAGIIESKPKGLFKED